MRAVYYPEVERLVKEVTGAAKVVVFDHNVRFFPEERRIEIPPELRARIQAQEAAGHIVFTESPDGAE